MSSNNNNNDKNNNNNNTMESVALANAEATTPVFRSIQVLPSSREEPMQITMDDHVSAISAVSVSRATTVDPFKASRDAAPLQSKQLEEHNNGGRGVGRDTGWSSPAVTQLPLFYPIATNHHVRMERDNLPTVLSNLQECFRLLSLHCRFRDSPVSATCKSMDAVELSVHVWEEKTKESTSQLIVEAQRISGDSIRCNHYIRKILAAAKQTSETVVVEPISKVRPILSPTTETTMYGVRAVEGFVSGEFPLDEEDSDVIFGESLEIVRSLLATDRYDARFLGLESLAFMSDKNKTRATAALRTAQAVLATDALVRDTIISLAFRGSWPKDQQYQMTGRSKDHDDDDDRYIQQHSYLALVTVVQSISLTLHGPTTGEWALAAGGEIVTDYVRLVDSCLGCEGRMIRCLLDMVVMAQQAPHTARLASLLLAMLCESNSNSNSKATIATGCSISNAVRETVPVNVVAQAQQVGSVSHAALETASTKLLIALQG